MIICANAGSQKWRGSNMDREGGGHRSRFRQVAGPGGASGIDEADPSSFRPRLESVSQKPEPNALPSIFSNDPPGCLPGPHCGLHMHSGLVRRASGSCAARSLRRCAGPFADGARPHCTRTPGVLHHVLGVARARRRDGDGGSFISSRMPSRAAWFSPPLRSTPMSTS